MVNGAAMRVVGGGKASPRVWENFGGGAGPDLALARVHWRPAAGCWRRKDIAGPVVGTGVCEVAGKCGCAYGNHVGPTPIPSFLYFRIRF